MADGGGAPPDNHGGGSVHTLDIALTTSSRFRQSLSATKIAAGPFCPPDISSFTYTPFYCEENVYLLCKKLCEIGVADPMGANLFVVFISNEEKKVPLWCQNAGKGNGGFVVWDYHVICIQSKSREGSMDDLVWDLDSTLPFPCPLNKYCSEAIRPKSLSYANRRIFRVVHAPLYICFFASDRSHMKDTFGNWVALPPKYEPIVAEDGTLNNIGKFIQMHAADILTNREDLLQGVFSNKYGVLVGEKMLERLFSQIHQ